ncbi:DNA-binding CsgD family transcriptional regulator/PAS domain-containing protein [Methylobacterium brachiatum]|uniref:DNA-binding CsgD family transcriptional regulator/PAS domain-containing protein n=1 Tax=Methylobacterium brachiatum TaxID=269660 RepID=A0AAJ1WUJ3_9HYPH|nr:helix-turn-helix transcriptional regulator [Methylobacterium brachiatum]MCB4803660.1 helix-turn-helix transcriptional regulator [Methylobacterium brachiatum]MDQ0542097.1 DNA-binding CsgD family transcriptional regulator/PAS domain-containing protein [Methylobacterium brachiatum]
MPGLNPALFARLHDDLEAGFQEDLEEAVVDPARWPDLIERVSLASGSEGALLLRTDRTALNALTTASLAESSKRYFEEGWHREDHRFRGLPMMRARGIAVDQDFTTPDEIARLPFYQDLLASSGLRWFAGVGFEVKGRLWCLALQRTVAQGLYEPHEQARLATLSPLLRRAGLLTAMIEQARLAGLAEAFDVIARAAMILDSEGRALRWNAAFGALFGADLKLAGGRLAVEEGEAARQLEALSRPSGRAPISAIVVARRDAAPIAIHVVPLVGPTRGLFAGASTLLIASVPGSAPVPAATILQTAYRLTPAEARLAQTLSGGLTLAEAASRFAITAATARSQLKAIFAKTGATRQSDLIRLVTGLAR